MALSDTSIPIRTSYGARESAVERWLATLPDVERAVFDGWMGDLSVRATAIHDRITTDPDYVETAKFTVAQLRAHRQKHFSGSR